MTYGEIWKTLSAVDVSPLVEKKGDLSYLSWASAWRLLMERYPESVYELGPMESCPDGSLMVSLTVRIGECSRSMWLPVMDNRNNAITSPSTRDISDTRMRCLVKCLAMFGLAHYLYAGEDAPEPEKFTEKKPEPKKKDWKPTAITAIVEQSGKLLDSVKSASVGIAAVHEVMTAHGIVITPEEISLRDGTLKERLAQIPTREKAGEIFRELQARMPK